MVTKTGDKRIYEEYQMGAAGNKEDMTDDTFMLIFTEVDNQTQHMFKTTRETALQFAELIKQTAAGQKIQVAPASALHDLDKRGRRG